MRSLKQTAHSTRSAGNALASTFSPIASNKNYDYIASMKEKDANKEALEQVEKTESAPVKGEDLLKSEDLKRKLADSKKRITADNTARP